MASYNHSFVEALLQEPGYAGKYTPAETTAAESDKESNSSETSANEGFSFVSALANQSHENASSESFTNSVSSLNKRGGDKEERIEAPEQSKENELHQSNEIKKAEAITKTFVERLKEQEQIKQLSQKQALIEQGNYWREYERQRKQNREQGKEISKEGLGRFLPDSTPSRNMAQSRQRSLPPF